jgi:group I intron endonuclease
MNIIYKIVNLVNDKFYVGSTNNKKVRFRQHRKLLRRNKHHCKHLQASWNKYGEDKFKFVVVEEVDSDTPLHEVEELYLMRNVGKPHCYNSGYSAKAPWRNAPKEKTPNFGKAVTEAQKQQISKTLKAFYAEDYTNHPRVGKHHSAETRAKISASKLANPVKYWEGKERSEETKRKISEAQAGKPKAVGRKLTEEGRKKVMENIAAGRSHKHWLGRVHTEEAKAKMSRELIGITPDGSTKSFPSLTYVRDTLKVGLATIIRACKTGKQIQFGSLAGWRFAYADNTGVLKKTNLCYARDGVGPAALVVLHTDLIGDCSEWPARLEYIECRDGAHHIRTDVAWIPEDLEKALLELVTDKPLHSYFWKAAHDFLPGHTLTALFFLAERLGKPIDTPTNP